MKTRQKSQVSCQPMTALGKITAASPAKKNKMDGEGNLMQLTIY
jgi:hypothetical protein